MSAFSFTKSSSSVHSSSKRLNPSVTWCIIPVTLAGLNSPWSKTLNSMAKVIWKIATQTAQSQMSQNHQNVQQAQIQTMEKEKCWLILMVLQREQELEEMVRWLESTWQELDGVRSLLEIRRNQ
ncbi:hypothetical protein EV424DRAFT_1346229 [Suillus variegatus]|nr:hypothetical protein EV424DRAFT_1346229 [Suillus variegatus]